MIRPSDLELGRLRRHMHANFDDTSVADALAQLPAADGTPSSVQEWIALAVAVRQTRSLAHIFTGLKTMIGDRVIHPRLDASGISHSTIHRFDDTGDEFRQMVAGTLRPSARPANAPVKVDRPTSTGASASSRASRVRVPRARSSKAAVEPRG